ncbi:hypothetical protein AMATHDRAFT_2351 [Amanita thiersii Skay4041]|uniref:Uncharacterized protein n=1 Tax=Amanita thiersii Skay4041 TaxID=703135 RepID=A0A2A9NUZ2_9AGAR|nr:hypothetical protein AMATHDRAFT_2351 [Amanita thiersii Skay4041]
MSASSTQSSQQQPRQRKPPFANYPTIKILTPPQGKFSPKVDEWCLTYCSQTIKGRIHGKEPYCRSVCLRKVFPYEVRNIIHFKQHRQLGPDGKAKYPLPLEGQPENIPRFLGGKPPDDADEHPQQRQRRPDDTKYWDEGWYVWTSKDRWAMQEKTETMLMDLEQQQRLTAFKKERAERGVPAQAGQQQHEQQQQQGSLSSSKKWGYVVPLQPSVDIRFQSLLLPLPPEFPPFWERIHKLLTPTFRVLEIFRDSIASGEQKKFALRVWEKAWTEEPFILASRTFTRAYERWKDNEDDGNKDST